MSDFRRSTKASGSTPLSAPRRPGMSRRGHAIPREAPTRYELLLGSDNIGIGYAAGLANLGSGNIFLGVGADAAVP
ncbi:hypothetical protein AB5I41_30975 [Sphingomonas sp. MMS24-JH45]